MSDLIKDFKKMNDEQKTIVRKATAQLLHNKLHELHDMSTYLVDDSTRNDSDSSIKLHELFGAATIYLRIFETLDNL